MAQKEEPQTGAMPADQPRTPVTAGGNCRGACGNHATFLGRTAQGEAPGATCQLPHSCSPGRPPSRPQKVSLSLDHVCPMRLCPSHGSVSQYPLRREGGKGLLSALDITVASRETPPQGSHVACPHTLCPGGPVRAGMDGRGWVLSSYRAVCGDTCFRSGRASRASL